MTDKHIRILVVDDEHLITWALSQMLTKEGYAVETAATGAEAMEKFMAFQPILVMLDLNLPDTFGLDLLKQMREVKPNLAIIIITASSQADLAVNAFKLGADQFFGKPFSLDAIKESVARTLQERHLDQQEEVEQTSNDRRKKTRTDKLIGNSMKMVEISRLITICSSTDAKTVLITGESGTGKELVAHAIHQYSARSAGPFIEINCAAIPEHLIENELFGHDKGAFTDASKTQKGIFELADGGTVFLDEIGDMPFKMQIKLLKILETKRFRRLGSESDIECDVRIIAATNQNLPQMVAEGKFRGDLYYRLNMMTISLPPLRDRTEDIPAITQYFIDDINEEYGMKISGISDEVMEYLLAYNWPGNVRELRHSIERAMIMQKGGTLRNINLNGVALAAPSAPVVAPPAENSSQDTPVSATPAADPSIEDMERQLMLAALQQANGNQSKAAKFLKISRDTLRYRMKKYGLSGVFDMEGEASMLKDGVGVPPDFTDFNSSKWGTS